MPATPTPCPGPCSRAWRTAETAGTPHELQPAWGQPVHCYTCQTRTRGDLAAIPELLAAIWLEATNGTARPADVTTSRPASVAPWPGQASRLLTDLIVGGLAELEDDIRALRGLAPRTAAVREGAAVTASISFLDTHLSWAMEHHPAAGEIHERDSANPSAQIRSWHRMAQRFTSRDARLEQRQAPCKRCGWRSLFYADGEDYIECRNAECKLLMTADEYAHWAEEVAAKGTLKHAA
ncbi:hypothetical protein OG689_10955 [Kitasatospora sp. NBC_00240]|uniref:hypothetical protein n=1 Tax=Kitasatospora sp. NBC_00240 TaxID=2903567 RepID=UPI002252603E|nr:hypothetical protein [Kitasatospora sp. NBC_00240]MCX5209803.1 hypothetical protein [Kitasatospora sp. NBC_00240]